MQMNKKKSEENEEEETQGEGNGGGKMKEDGAAGFVGHGCWLAAATNGRGPEESHEKGAPRVPRPAQSLLSCSSSERRGVGGREEQKKGIYMEEVVGPASIVAIRGKREAE
ncbi:unnamed protein product [Caenorhabditis auriculariae]|uniref:Uncharacterized protein n=1 Tax=Caenorhabditis auriculariae TaxID=2777116 RepID=A0A8S1GS62_9PELO|nr:unnamed protein product [Caenorhabditis auriculariae]